MDRWLVGGLGVLAVLVAVGVAAVAGLSRIGATRWAEATATLHRQLDAAQVAPAAGRPFHAARDLDGLPPPVQRYLRAALPDGQRRVRSMDMAQTGTMDFGERTPRWLPFHATERATTDRPGFVWDAAVTMLPGVVVRVHDAYVAGEGRLHPAVFGLFSLADARDTGGELAQGELLRFLAEAPWYPTALLPGPNLRWEPVDERSARVTLRDGATAVTMTFRFGDDAMVDSVRAEARGRMVDGRSVPTVWEGRWSDYAVRDGMRVPLAGEVAWRLPEGLKSYWRGRVTRLTYTFVD
jgi:hypothetical protein